MQNQSWSHIGGKALMAGGFAAVASKVLLGESGNVPVFGVSIPAPIGVGIGVAAGSVSADLAHDYILPHIPGNDRFATIEGAALGIGTSALASAAVLQFAEGAPTESFMTSGIIGAASYVAADYTSNKLYGGGANISLFGY